ncbi:hypothetical protein HPO96_23255 [Kribbella sandramycini]|uniref:Uncharacterized protein n=1 Tax=Kribbella sandramycini TaxID=60450 RepID=A0A7Y4L4A0_9ACTN|nr:hypothetical protein [Kribbella sandramycini]MBB6566165.1 hypothetical protein [Kribbella sandramycini]NOL43167.1 hypothetical protein [Kribbella sandramycini]
MGVGAPFETAAQVRAGRLDAARYGVAPGSSLPGPGFVRMYVVMEVLHRYGYEALLWDEVGVGVSDADADELARLLVAADGGEVGAELALKRWVAGDARLRLGSAVRQLSPYGDPPVVVELRTRR